MPECEQYACTCRFEGRSACLLWRARQVGWLQGPSHFHVNPHTILTWGPPMAELLKAGRKKQLMVFSSPFLSLPHHPPPPPPPPRRLRPAALRMTPQTCPRCCGLSTRSILAWLVCFRRPVYWLPRWGVGLQDQGGGQGSGRGRLKGELKEQAAVPYDSPGRSPCSPWLPYLCRRPSQPARGCEKAP